MSDRPQEPREQQKTAPLNYLSPRDDDQLAVLESTRAMFGGILTFLTCFASLFFWIASRIRIHPATSPASYGPPSNSLPTVITVSSVALLSGIALFQYRRRNSTAFAKGILIGLGFTLLVAGFCYVAKSH